MKVPLPEGTRHSDVVRLKLTIDHNKILHWWYSVGQGEFTAASPFNDPGTPRQLDPSEKRLLAFRRQMADELAAKNQLSDDTVLQATQPQASQEGFPFPRTFHLLLPARQHLLGPQAQNNLNQILAGGPGTAKIASV